MRNYYDGEHNVIDVARSVIEANKGDLKALLVESDIIRRSSLIYIVLL